MSSSPLKLVLGVTTYNRYEYLKRLVVSWNKTRDRVHSWSLVIADDGSTDETLDYLSSLKIPGVHIEVIYNKRRGVHHQTNQILKFLGSQDFDCCFKVDDDLVFSSAGWDNAYYNAIKETGYDHLVFYDQNWGKRQRGLNFSVKLHDSGFLECQTRSHEVQGAFFTITPKVLKTVGFFDTVNFGPRGFGHADYTFRCCRAGLNEIKNPYDLRDSSKYLRLPIANYIASVSDRVINSWNTPEMKKQKKVTLGQNRIYIPYNEMDVDINRQPISKFSLSFIVPLRGRENHIPGFLTNIEKYYGEEDYEILLVSQEDDELFKRGQLCNLGFQRSRGEVVIFIDIDIRFLKRFDFRGEIESRPDRPVLAFTHIQQLDESSEGEFKLHECQPRPEGYGGCGAFTREQFEKCNGFSNLVIGWGAEDNLINERCRFRRVKNTLGHVRHSRDTEEDPRQTDWYKRNKFFWFTDSSRDHLEDGFLQTTSRDVREEEISGSSRKKIYRFGDVSVSDNFHYSYYLNPNREFHGHPIILPNV